MKKLSRRDMLKLMGAGAGSAALASTGIPFDTKLVGVVKAQDTVTLDVIARQPEYLNLQRQIWDIFERENPGIKINLFAVNENEYAALQARIAGGYIPHIATTPTTTTDAPVEAYSLYYNLSELSDEDFPWWDRWTFDIKNAFTDIYGVPGPRSLEIMAPWTCTWHWHQDLMEEAGLDPRSVTTWEEFQALIEQGTEWAKSRSDVDHFLDLGWHPLVALVWTNAWALAFPEGQQENQNACWRGEKKFNDEDSPWRPVFQWLKDSYDKGILPESWWTREWEADFEASYIAKKSVMVFHGPWLWDKALAADPTITQLGLPATPPAAGQDTWVQYLAAIDTFRWYALIDGVQDLPEWPQVKKAWAWWHSPAVVKMRAEGIGSPVVYTLDEPLELEGAAQWEGVRKDIDIPGGVFENTKFVDPANWAETQAGAYIIPGSTNTWDHNGNASAIFGELMEGKKSVQDVLDWAQANFEASYKFPEA
ncbi:MAG TPA: ABC transporter substrate-binding protein [Aggregatilinea sp.]|jgi:ABC-type glycerol-3-phosphate transport system substrate-binding protein|uniref:ABC transporter substrate-binding protein n=1 Tax=Aggregatilinea sp. TaxID=2806333 RepID=UPI002C70C969|nr:ABC transporter substrate-binding protein [Aggregatilinea sp.]HML20892.1 ABC transporter substrate-binding protein [Aggregatilinea sp.]